MVSKNNMHAKTVFVGLIPVLHTAYIDLFKKYSTHVYILGDSILKEWEGNVFLQRDLRRLDQKTIADLIAKSGLVENVTVLEKDAIGSIADCNIVMPKEDVSEWFAQTFFPNKKVIFENVFLRWNRPISLQELVVNPERIISREAFHNECIKKATHIADKSANWWRQIGSLIVKDGEVILGAYNRHVPTQSNIDVYGDLRMCFNAGEFHEFSNSIHAEASLIGQAARKGISLAGTDLYVTTFPCPTCAKLIVEAGIRAVYYKDGYSLSDAENVLKAAQVHLIKVE